MSKRAIRPSRRPPRVPADPQRLASAFPLGDYLLPARDATGGHVSMSTVTVPAHLRVSARLVSQALFGFENSADVMRWCLQYGLDELARRSRDPNLMATMAELRSWLTELQAELEHARYYLYHQNVESGIDRLQEAGHETRARSIADRVVGASDKIDQAYWRRKFRKIAVKRTRVEETGEESE